MILKKVANAFQKSPFLGVLGQESTVKFNIWISLVCATMSKAFEKSRIAIFTCSLLSITAAKSFVVKKWDGTT